MSSDFLSRRSGLLICGCVFALLSALTWYRSWDVASGFGTASLFRLSLVCLAGWAAWPSLRSPAKWFPPGVTVIVLIAIGACAVQPRLAIALVPAVGSLIAFAGFVRFFRGS